MFDSYEGSEKVLVVYWGRGVKARVFGRPRTEGLENQ